MVAPPPPTRVLQYLRGIDSPLVDAAVSDGLEVLTAEQSRVAVDLLLARARPSAYRVLIDRYDALPPDQRRRVHTAGGLILSQVDDVVHAGSSQSRVNALTVLRASVNLSLAHLAADALADRSADVRRAAADTLRTMTDTVLQRRAEAVAALGDMVEPTPRWQALCNRLLDQVSRERAPLLAALRAALDGFTTHHQSDVIESALFLCDDLGDMLFEHQVGQRGRFSQAITERLTQTDEPRLAAAIYEGLPHPELERGLVQFICTCRDSAVMAALIEQQWRATRPAVADAMRQVYALAWLEQGVSPLMTLPPALHAPGVRWLARLGLPEDVLLDLLRGVLDYDSEPAWAAAVWAVCGYRTPKATQLLGLLAEVPCTTTARAARLVLMARAPRRRNSRTPTDAISRWSEFLRTNRLEASFESLWAFPDRVDPNNDLQAEDVRRHIPDFEKLLRSRLCSALLDDRRRALSLVAAVKMEDACKNDLFTLADDGDAGIRAGVMVALGRIGDATSKRILERGVNDADPHVRIAAIESMAVVNPQRGATAIRSRLADEAPSVRIAAIRGMLIAREPDAAVALVRTLADDLAPHRLAALSLAAQLKLTALQPRLMEMATEDPEQQVRQRAAKLLKAWAQDAPAGHAGPTPAAAPTAVNHDESQAAAELQPLPA